MKIMGGYYLQGVCLGYRLANPNRRDRPKEKGRRKGGPAWFTYESWSQVGCHPNSPTPPDYSKRSKVSMAGISPPNLAKVLSAFLVGI